MSQQTGGNKTTGRLGYPLMESLVETEDFNTVNTSMSACYDLLERQLKQKTGGMSKQKKIRSALKAYDLTIDLIRFLLKTKYELIQKNEGVQKK